MSAEQIPGTLKVQCSCGWQGITEDLEDKTCPICGEAFEAYPTSGVALGLIYGCQPLRTGKEDQCPTITA